MSAFLSQLLTSHRALMCFQTLNRLTRRNLLQSRRVERQICNRASAFVTEGILGCQEPIEARRAAGDGRKSKKVFCWIIFRDMGVDAVILMVQHVWQIKLPAVELSLKGELGEQKNKQIIKSY